MNDSLLTWLVFLPIAGAVLLAALPRQAHATLRGLALAVFVAVLALAAYVFFSFPTGEAGFRFATRAPWVPGFDIDYHLAVDGISLPLVLLTAFLFPVALLGTWDSVREKLKEYLALLLLLEGAVLGTFLALDLVLFYIFWEAVLIPMYFLIGVWGGKRRAYAALKFFLFTMAGSLLMLLAIAGIYLSSGTFSVVDLYAKPLPAEMQGWLFAAFALAFAIKVPVFPLHTWLPDAHVEAPTAGSVILAGVLLKMGTYGFLRFCLPLFPEASRAAAPWMLALAVVGILYGAAVAWAQADMKKLVAYSSVSHLGFVMLGTFAFTIQGLQGAVLQSVNHGLSTGALFLLVGVLYERAHTREMAAFGGVAKVMPTFAALSLIVVFSSAALPGTNGFVGEFLILLGTFRADWRFAVLAVPGVVLSAIYLLTMVQRVFFGPVNVDAKQFPALSARETLALVALIATIFWIGLYPKPFLERSEAALDRLSKIVHGAPRAEVAPGSGR